MAYNQNNTVSSIRINEEAYVDFTYQDGMITTVEVYMEGTLSFTFVHEAQGHVESFAINGIVTHVNYDFETDSYYYVNEDGDEKIITLTEYGDIASMLFFDGDGLTFQYDEMKNGSMKNSNNVQLYMAFVFDSLFTIFMQLSKKPIVEVSGYFNAIFQNTYDNHDFIIEQSFVGEMNEVEILPYHYF